MRVVIQRVKYASVEVDTKVVASIKKGLLVLVGIEDADNALEMIFSSKHYESIIKVFKKSLVEFVLCFIVLFFVWASTDNLAIKTINRIVVSGILLTSLAITRSLYVLFVVLDLDKHNHPN